MNKKHTLKEWITAVRPWSFPASSMPALVAFMFVFFYRQQIDIAPNWLFGILSILGAVIYQISGNLISDYFDYKRGVDREDTFGSSRLLVNGTFAPKTILRLGLGFLSLGALLGVVLVYYTGWPLLVIGVLGFIAALFYYQFKYIALGDLLIFLVYGPLITLGTFYAMTGMVDWKVIWLSIPIGCITVNILHANNTRDIAHDRRAGIRTQAMLLGIKGSIAEYILLVAVTYGTLIGMVAAGFLAWPVLGVLLTLPIAVKNCKLICTASVEHPSRIVDLDVRTAQLQLVFSSLFALLLFISCRV
ncbi:MAG: 1,4-dihydroxy-2-naphthoate octaprenyltransferase [Culturomica sp.]|nr:1,4-dihydroxy-2-naphthoate octaprenyltransferase [Culturomica sp.]